MDQSASVLFFDEDVVYREAIAYREDSELALAKIGRVLTT
jgi:hypothetical protein